MARLYLSPPELAGNELDLLRDALGSGWIAPLGPHVDAFEREVCEVVDMPHALATSSGTAALHLALEVIGTVPGDEIWVATLTFAASANAVRYAGATPVFVDSHRATWNIDPGLLAEELDAAARRGKLPRAVVTVDLYGQCADYDPILEACRRHGVILIEDAAEALGATYRGRPAGSFGDLAILSFNGNKIITTSGGGMLLARRKAWIDRARYLATQARSPARHYEHEVVGYNYRLSNLLAAVGRAQLADLSRRVDRRRAINATYREALGARPGWSFMPEGDGMRSTCWLTCALVDPLVDPDRDAILDRLEQTDIEARPVWKPMHLQPAFHGCRLLGGGVSDDLFARGLCLPSGSGITRDEQQLVIDTIVASDHADARRAQRIAR
ncbi:MAG: aminotransferase class I/II-fold pyridoxal phosphate-dependent enzyme [Deltaproteobacteria bacterium]|nr:aminotransferase class I/II-fold pyridoxal phosphate-dependent enzyme [Deltaproteobacteria bacterium]